MKRLLTIFAMAVLCQSAVAQFYTTQDFEHAIRFFNRPAERREIILPTVDGYRLYKADFHTHTIYSDGDVTPRQRVREAWYDGLDIIAITDHLEIRTYEKFMLKVLAPYSTGKPFKYQNAGIANKKDKSYPVMANLNAAYDEAVYYTERENLPIMVVRGTEIWRNTKSIGEFNALFPIFLTIFSSGVLETISALFWVKSPSSPLVFLYKYSVTTNSIIESPKNSNNSLSNSACSFA